VFAAIAASFDSDALAGTPGEFLDHRGRDRLLPRAFRHRLGAVGIGLGLIADRFQAHDALLQRRVFQAGDAALDGVVQPLEPQICLGGALVQFRDVFAPTFGSFLAAVENRGEHFL
jgi:hypothetical protein